MRENSNFDANEISFQVKKIRAELDKIREEKSKLKVKLFYEPDNQDVINKLKILKERNIELNSNLTSLNNELLEILSNSKQ